jgi:hypothetical protein
MSSESRLSLWPKIANIKEKKAGRKIPAFLFTKIVFGYRVYSTTNPLKEKQMQVLGKVFQRDDSDQSPGITLTIEKQMRGAGDIDFLCGGCFTVLGENLAKPFFKGDCPIRCPNCRAWNLIPLVEEET